MEICQDGHEEVCFNIWECPVCKAMKSYENKIEVLEEDLQEAEKEIETLSRKE